MAGDTKGRVKRIPKTSKRRSGREYSGSSLLLVLTLALLVTLVPLAAFGEITPQNSLGGGGLSEPLGTGEETEEAAPAEGSVAGSESSTTSAEEAKSEEEQNDTALQGEVNSGDFATPEGGAGRGDTSTEDDTTDPPADTEAEPDNPSTTEEELQDEAQESIGALSDSEGEEITPLASLTAANQTQLFNAIATTGATHTINLTANFQLTDRINIPAGKTITLTGSRTITAASGIRTFYVYSGGKLILNGPTVSGGLGGHIVAGGSCELRSGEIRGVSAAGYPGVMVNGTFIMSGGYIRNNTGNDNGAGVALMTNGAIFTMSGGTISGNRSTNYGGGVHLTNGAIFTMSGGTITGNSAAANGGGLTLGGASCTFSMSGGTISSNSAGTQGGAIASNGKITLSNAARIENNTTTGYGGGINLGESGSLTMSGGAITGNSALRGGGINTTAAAVTLNAGTISGNKATSGGGGGIYTAGYNALSVANGVVFSGNSASSGTFAGAAASLPASLRTIYTSKIKGVSWSSPFTQGYNNADISVVLYTVTFNGNGGTVASANTIRGVSPGTSLNADMPPAPTRPGYTFTGWNTAQTGGTAATAFTSATAVSASRTVYAQWSPNPYTVTFRNFDNTSTVSTKTVSYNAQIGALPTAPTREGYDFKGWYTSLLGGTQIAATTPVTAAVTYYAQYTLQSRTVVFDANGGVFSTGVTQDTKTTNYNTPLGAGMPTPPTREGYTFTGWNTLQTGGDATTACTSATVITQNSTVYAQWQVEVRTVTFVPKGGILLGSTTRSTNWNTPLDTNMPQDPTKEGYSFSGWYTEEEGAGTLFTSLSPVTENLTVYAFWATDTYTVTFNANAGAFLGGSTIQTKITGWNTSLGSDMPTPPTKEGHTFKGWNTEPNETGTPFSSSTPVTENSTVYAIWTVDTATVTFDGNTGSVLPENHSRTLNWNTSLGARMPSALPIKEGHTFKEWNTLSDGSGAAFESVTPVTQNTTVYAVWIIDTLTVTFSANGGALAPENESRQTNWNTSLGVNMPPEPTKEGHSFKGWNSASDASGSSFTQTTLIKEDIVVYATWVIDTVTVTFDANTGVVLAENIARSLQWNSALQTNMPQNPIKEGHSFKEWNTASDGTGSLFTSATAVKANTVVYAIWNIDTVTVTFNGNTGSVAPENESRQTNWNTSLGVNMPPEPTKEGHSFKGWNTRADGTGTPFSRTTTVREDTTLSAIWIIDTHTVVFLGNGGVILPEDASRSLPWNTSLDTNMPSVPTNEGHTFKEWNTLADGTGTPFTSATIIKANTTLYAIWLTGTLTVSFDGNGLALDPTAYTPLTANWNTSLGLRMHPDPVRAGYAFASWNTRADGSGKTFTSLSALKEDLTLYAIWSVPNDYMVSFVENGGEIASGDATRLLAYTYSFATDPTDPEDPKRPGPDGMPQDPLREGHIFKEWNTLPDGTGNVFTEATVLDTPKSITVYATWEAEERTVTFDARGGMTETGDAERTVEWDSPLGQDMPPLPEKEGHTFKEWNTLPDGSGTAFTETTHVKDTLTVYAIWTLNTHTVTFEANGGIVQETDEVRITSWNTALDTSMPPTPTRDGRTFREWNTSSDGTGVIFTASSIVTEDLVVYALWSDLFTMTVIFEGEGGEFQGGVSSTSKTTSYNTPLTSANMPEIPVREGHDFLSWNTASDGSGSTFSATTPLTQNSTVYAIWNVQTRTVTFDGGGGSVSATDRSRTLTWGSALASDLPTTLPLREGYSFKEWNTSLDGTGEVFTSLSVVKENITVYAIWSIEKRTVTFEASGGEFSLGVITTSKQTDYNTSLGASMPTLPTREGHDFLGWNSAPDGSGTTFTSTTLLTGDTTVYALWKVQMCTVTFDANGGSIALGDINRAVEWNTPLLTAMPSVLPQKAGYAFKEWNTSSDGSGTVFTNATPLRENTTVYAIWKADKKTVSFNANGGSILQGDEARTLDYNTSLGLLMPPSPIREGHSFREWNTRSDGTGSTFTSATLIPEDTTVYALWEVQEVTVTFEANGGIGDTTEKTRRLKWNTSLGSSMPHAPTKEGHDFKEWNTLPDGTGTLFDSATIVTEDRVLYATWTPQLRTVTFNANGGSIDGADTTRTLEWGSALESALPTHLPTKEGYRFKEWNTLTDGSGSVFSALTVVRDNLTVYAIWTPEIKTVSFNANGGSLESIPPTLTLDYGTSLDTRMPVSLPQKEGYGFLEWNTASDSTGTTFTSLTVVTEDTVVYAIWEVQQKTVTFNANGGSIDASEAMRVVEWGVPLGTYLPSAHLLLREGHSFKEWNTLPDGTGTVFDTTTVVTEDLTLYAIWKAELKEVTFEANGGSIAASDEVRTLDYGTSLGANFPMSLPVREGYTFMGWNTSNDGSGAVFDALTPVTEDMVVYALWSSPPFVSLHEPYLETDGSVSLSGYIVYTGHTYDARLRYRERGTENWVELSFGTASTQTGDLNISGSIDASSLKRDTLYEVELRAENTTEDRLSSQSTVYFSLPPLEEEGIFVEGTLTNESSLPLDITVSLMEGSVVIKSYTIFSLLPHTSTTYRIEALRDGSYNIVADSGIEKITEALHIQDSNVLNTPHFTFRGEGRTESTVEIAPALPPLAIGNLPSLFEIDALYTESDKTLVSEGGTVEMRLKASELDSDTKDILSQEAQGSALRVMFALDLSLIKVRYSETGLLLSEDNITDTTLPLLEITLPLEERLKGRVFERVLRLHENASEIITKDETEGEYFLQDEDSVTIYASRFSGYALVQRLYTLSLAHTEGGYTTEAAGSYTQGDELVLEAYALEGYSFKGWSVTGLNKEIEQSGTRAYFTMPLSDVEVFAEFVGGGTAGGSSIPSTGDGAPLAALLVVFGVGVLAVSFTAQNSRSGATLDDKSGATHQSFS